MKAGRNTRHAGEFTTPPGAIRCRDFYFDVLYNGRTEGDAATVELANDGDAWVEATSACGQMIKDLDGALKANTDWRMEVFDEQRQPLFRLSVRAERLAPRPK